MTENKSIAHFDSYLLPAIVLITLALFSPVLWHDFVNYDDDLFVYANPNIQSGLTLDAVHWAFTSFYEVNWIPLTWISHMLDIQLFGMNPAGHHLVNVLLHSASSALLFSFLKRATGAPWRSAAVAVLFAVHPLHVESVAWVAERKDVLSTFFGMLTLYAYTRYSERPELSRYLATLVFFLLGLLAKPMLVTLPVVLLMIDWWPLGRLSIAGEGNLHSPRIGNLRVLVEKIPFLILAAASSIITYLAQFENGEFSQGYTFLSRAGKACIAYITYLCKMVWPVKLALIYPFPKYPPGTAKILVSLILLLLVTGVVVRLRKRCPYMVIGWGWYIVTLLPVIGLIQIGYHSVADRYTYVPLIGIFVMVSWGVPQLLEGWKSRGVVLFGMSAVTLATMIVLTSMQLKHWKNGFTIFTHAIEVTENNWVAQNNLGLMYFDEGRTDEAIRHFEESIKAKPSYALAYLNLGVAHQARNEFDEAVEAFKWVLQFEPANPKAHFSLGLVYVTQGNRNLAMAEFQTLQNSGSTFAPALLDMINASPAVRTAP